MTTFEKNKEKLNKLKDSSNLTDAEEHAQRYLHDSTKYIASAVLKQNFLVIKDVQSLSIEELSDCLHDCGVNDFKITKSLSNNIIINEHIGNVYAYNVIYDSADYIIIQNGKIYCILSKDSFNALYVFE